MRDLNELATQRAYHHGDLKSALLAAAESILEQDGIQGLTLRAAARAVGVSHAAPLNHFDDLTGLLSELAAVGFNRFSQALRAEAASTKEPARGMGRAYIAFARAHPKLFMLMFRAERLDPARPALAAATTTARQTWCFAFCSEAAGLTPMQAVGQGVALWSIVHGFSMLLLDGRLDGLIASLSEQADADDLREAVFDGCRFAI